MDEVDLALRDGRAKRRAVEEVGKMKLLVCGLLSAVALVVVAFSPERAGARKRPTTRTEP